MNTVYNSTEAFFHFTNEKLIFCGIKTNEITTAYICVVKKYRDFDFDDLNLVNTLSKTLSIQIQKNNLFISTSGLEEEYYLNWFIRKQSRWYRLCKRKIISNKF